uniref:Uncharacterized protein n=1 Tax=Anguilla anguilla TaxID=7936 RepID=A0A0E9PGP4_ANGAN
MKRNMSTQMFQTFFLLLLSHHLSKMFEWLA